LKGGKMLNADYSSFINAAASSRTSYTKRLELCRNDWADSGNGDAFEALKQFRVSAGRALDPIEASARSARRAWRSARTA
jgi:hypothetical protein